MLGLLLAANINSIELQTNCAREVQDELQAVDPQYACVLQDLPSSRQIYADAVRNCVEFAKVQVTRGLRREDDTSIGPDTAGTILHAIVDRWRDDRCRSN